MFEKSRLTVDGVAADMAAGPASAAAPGLASSAGAASPDVAADVQAIVADPFRPGALEVLRGIDLPGLPLGEAVVVVQAWETLRRHVEAGYLRAYGETLQMRAAGSDARADTAPGGPSSAPGGSPVGGAADPRYGCGAPGTVGAAVVATSEALAGDRYGAGQAARALSLQTLAVAEEVRLALGFTLGQLGSSSRYALALAGPYRAARETLAAGRISAAQVRDLREITATVPDDALPDLLARVLPAADEQSAPAFRRTVSRAVTRAVPTRAAAEVAVAREERHITLQEHRPHEAYGSANAHDRDATGARIARASWLSVSTDPVQARRIHHLIDAHARRLRAAARHQVTAAATDARTRRNATADTLLRHLAATGAGPAAAATGVGADAYAAAATRSAELQGATAATRAEVDAAQAEVDAAQAEVDAAQAEVEAAEGERERVYRIPLGAWRVDALEHLLQVGALHAADGPVRSHGRPVELVVVADLDTVTGLATHPAELRGYGTLPPAALHDLQAAARGWLLTITDNAGAPLTALTYKPTMALQDFITATRPTCTSPHCTVPVHWTQNDHTVPYDHHRPHQGGPTDQDNLNPLCIPHHQLKTHAGFITETNPDRSITTRTPAGHTYLTPPPQLLPEEHVPPQRDPGAQPKHRCLETGEMDGPPATDRDDSAVP